MPTILSTLFEQFSRERQYLHNVTAKTLAWYECSWVAFSQHIDPELPSDQLTEQALKAAAVGLREAGLKPVSINTYLRCINAWLRWMHQEGHVQERMKVTGPKAEQRVLPVLGSNQIRQIVQWKPKHFSHKRLHLVVLLILDSGLRISEVLGISRDDINLEQSTIRVMGKGRRERVLPISLELRRHLVRWMQHHQYELVFSGRAGSRLTVRYIQRQFKWLQAKLKIEGVRMSPHTLRHTFAAHYIRSGGGEFRLQRMLGHSTLEMTRWYVNLQTEDLQAVHQQCSVVAKVGK